ncbi:MAG: 6-phosphogluconolactonase [Betaproteobacteria bacterium]
MTTPSHATPTRTAATPRIERFRDVQALADAVAGLVAAAVTQGVQRRGRASLVFSGGGTPALFLPHVATLSLPWEKVSVLLADERWVEETSPDSNAGMLRRMLLDRAGPAQARFIPLKNTAASAGEGVAGLRTRLPPLDQRYDLVLLGMGNDGHFASLFPGSPRLAQLLSPDNNERAAAVPAPTTADPKIERITLTLAELKRSERILLVIQGVAKLDALVRAWQGGDALRTPVVALGDVEVFWCP